MSKPSVDWRECQTAWFALLERARIDGDTARIEIAIANLRRLGVRVSFDSPPEPPKPPRPRKPKTAGGAKR